MPVLDIVKQQIANIKKKNQAKKQGLETLPDYLKGTLNKALKGYSQGKQFNEKQAEFLSTAIKQTEPEGPVLKGITKKEFVTGEARAESFFRKPAEVIKQAPIVKAFKEKKPLYFPAVGQAAAGETEQEKNIGNTLSVINPLSLDFAPIQLLGGILGGIEETTGVNWSERAFGVKKEKGLRPKTPGESLGGTFLRGFINKVPALGGKEPLSKDPEINDAIKIAMGVVFNLGYGVMKDIATVKYTHVGPNEIKKALIELTAGRKVGASKEALTAAQTAIDEVNQGIPAINKVLKEGATIKEQRDLIGWVRKIFQKRVDPAPEIKAFLTETTGFKAATKEVVNSYTQRALAILRPFERPVFRPSVTTLKPVPSEGGLAEIGPGMAKPPKTPGIPKGQEDIFYGELEEKKALIESAQDQLKGFDKNDLSLFNSLIKTIGVNKTFQAGDIETLRGSKAGEKLNQSIERFKEVKGDMSEDEALEAIMKLPTQTSINQALKDIKVSEQMIMKDIEIAETPEEKEVRRLYEEILTNRKKIITETQLPKSLDKYLKLREDTKKMIKDSADKILKTETGKKITTKVSLEDMIKESEALNISAKDLKKLANFSRKSRAVLIKGKEMLSVSAENLRNLITKYATTANQMETAAKEALLKEINESMDSYKDIFLSARELVAESGRTLFANKTILKTNKDILNNYDRILGPEDIAKLAKDFTEIDAGKALNQSLTSDWIDKIMEVRNMGLISNPNTHLVNIYSNITNKVLSIPDKVFSAMYNLGEAVVKGKPREVFFREVKGDLIGTLIGIPEGAVNLFKALLGK